MQKPLQIKWTKHLSDRAANRNYTKEQATSCIERPTRIIKKQDKGKSGGFIRYFEKDFRTFRNFRNFSFKRTLRPKDFGAEFTPELLEPEERLRAEIEKNQAR